MATASVDGNSLCCELLQMVCDPIFKLSATLEKNDSGKNQVERIILNFLSARAV